MTRFVATGLIAGIMTIYAAGLQADVLNLSDGSRIVGTIEEINADQAKLSNTFAGDLSVPRSAIVSVETEAPVTVQLEDGAYLTGRLDPRSEGGVVIQVADVGARPLTLGQVQGIYREDPVALQRRALAVRVSADANVGIALTSGNSESENFALDGRLVTRTQRNRYTFGAKFIREESEGTLIKKNWNALVKYDHFVSDKWFWFNSATFENDRFADLELRTAIAAGMGYQFFDTDARSLSIETGPSYIDENFIVAEDDNFFGARWALNYDQRIWNGLAFFHYNEALLGLEDTDELTVRSRTGFRLNITERIVARIQTTIDWDNSPPADTENTDLEHTLTIGYRF
jgi:putative salt-induced outer membrane protein YdiY